MVVLALAALIGFSEVSPPHAAPDDRLIMLGRSPAFHAKVDGHDAILELDTGSFELRLSPEFADKYSIDRNSVKLQLGDQPDQVLKPVVEPLEQDETPSLADSFRVKSDGIVGLDVLRHYAVGINLTDHRISFWPGGKVGSDFAKKWTAGALPLLPPMVKLEMTTRSADDWFRVQTKINGQPLDTILDTGTAVCSVNPSLVAKLHLRKVAETEVEEIGKNAVLPVMEADSITFGTLSADFPILNVEEENDPDSDGILGTEALGLGKYIVDMPDNKLYVRRDPNAGAENAFDWRLRAAGLDIFPSATSRLLVLVRPGSAADRAGVKSGDSLLYLGKESVDDFDPKALEGDPTAARKMMRIGMTLFQKDLTVTVKRQDGTRIVLPLPPLESKRKKH